MRTIAVILGLIMLPGAVVAQLCPLEMAFAELLNLDTAVEAVPGEAPWAAPLQLAPFAGSAAMAQAPANVYLADPAKGDVVEVVLQRLHGTGQVLDGRYAKVRSNRLELPGQATGGIDGQADFRFEPADWEAEDCINVLEECSAFDAVNVYFHLDRMATEFWLDRFGVDPPFQADVVTHISGDGAFADPARDAIKFSSGSLFMRNAAKEDEIIYHEYSHLVASFLGFELTTDTPVEARALGEGYADYFAATFTGEPRIGEWIVTCPPRQQCEGPPNDTDFRTLATDPVVWNWQGGNPSSTLKYGICTRFHEGDRKCKISWNNFIPLYTWGMIWSGLLWDLREELGPDVMDFLAVEGVSNTESRTETFERAVDRLVVADRKLFNGAHVIPIIDAAERRGIAAATGVADGPGSLPLRISVHPSPGSSRMQVELDLDRATSLVVRTFDASGRVIQQLFSGMATFGRTTWGWDVSALSGGVYFVRVDTEDGGRLVTPVVVAR